MDCHIAGQTRLLTALRERTEGSPRIASRRYSGNRGRAGPCPPAGEARAEEQSVSAAAGMGRRTRGSARAARGVRGMGVRSAQDGRMARRSSPRSPIGRWCVRRDDTRAREVRLPPILFRRVTVTNMKARTSNCKNVTRETRMGLPPSLLCLPPTFYFPNVHSGGGARSGFCEPTWALGPARANVHKT